MKIVLAGRDTFKRRLIECQVRWCIDHLNLERSACTLEILVKKNLRKRTGANGLTGRRDDIIGIVIDAGLDMSQIMVSVAHEMVHVKQMAQGKLKYFVENDIEVAFWCGKRLEHLPYLDRPWEIEAYGKQEIMARRFNESLKRLVNERKRKI